MEDEKKKENRIRFPVECLDKLEQLGDDEKREMIDLYFNWKGKIKNIDIQSKAADEYVKKCKKFAKLAQKLLLFSKEVLNEEEEMNDVIK